MRPLLFEGRVWVPSSPFQLALGASTDFARLWGSLLSFSQKRSLLGGLAAQGCPRGRWPQGQTRLFMGVHVLCLAPAGDLKVSGLRAKTRWFPLLPHFCHLFH